MNKYLALLLTLVVICACAAYVVLRSEPPTPPVGASPVSFVVAEGGRLAFENGQPRLCFETRILTSELEALGEGAVVGTLILPTDMLTGAFTVLSEGALNLTSMDSGSLVSDGEYTVFSVAISEIHAQNFTRSFSVRSYIRVGDTYYYSAYSDEKNASSVYGLAVSAWEAGDRENPDVKSCLDKVILLDAELKVIPLAGYDSPYAVSYESGDLTVTAVDGSLAEGDVVAIVIDGTVYTGGWTVENNALIAPYGD